VGARLATSGVIASWQPRGPVTAPGTRILAFVRQLCVWDYIISAENRECRPLS